MQHIKHYSLGLLVVFALLLGALISAQPALAMTGDGTSAHPYQIATADDLIEFAKKVNSYNPWEHDSEAEERDAWAELRNDINLEGTEWTRIGSSNSSYHLEYIGTFDGNNHIIRGLSINTSSTSDEYFGLFGAVGKGGTVRNLTVEGSITVESSDSYIRAGGVAGESDGTVSNCTNRVTIAASSDDIAYVGGVIGANAGNVSNCANEADITATANTAYIGGVIGFNGGSLTNCSNSGAVEGTGQTANGAYVGGIVGSNSHTEIVMGSVENCYNTGTVTATGSNAVAGGVAGINLKTVSSCYNTGTVTGTTTAGGVVGANIYGTSPGTPGTVTSCYNIGKVTAPSEGATIGGVVGANSNGTINGTVNGCYYLNTVAGSAIGDGSGTSENVASKTTEEFASGEVAWLLQDALGENADQAWGQKLSGETPDEYPVLTSDTSKKVYQVTFKDSGSTFATDYANSGDSVTLPEHDSTAGKTFNGWYNQESDGEKYTDPIIVSGSDLTVFAQFTENAPALGAGYDINYTAETATAAENYQISTNGTDFSKDTCNITPDGTLYVCYEGNKIYTTNPIPARPDAPTVQGVNETVAGKNDGKITGLNSEQNYQYRTEGISTWTEVAADSTEITGLAPGTYQVRIKAGTNSFASEAASVIIASGDAPTYTLTVSAPTFGNVNEGYTQPAAQALTITNSGNSDATISSVTVDSANFTIAGSGAAVPAGGSISSWTIQPAAGLSSGTYSATITVTYNNDATATANVQFIVEAAPVDPEDPVDPAPDDPPYNGKYSYEIVSDVGENGTIDVDRYVTEGDQVTITVSPDEAYLLDDLTVTSGGKDVALTDNGDGTYTFTMPSGDVAVTATFAEDPNWEEPEDPATDVSEIFTDVPANHWAQAAIQYVYDNGLMTGVSDTAFAPEATTTRAMIVSMLARMENVTSAADAGFSDVAADDWYATAVNWAAANGIVNGISADTFAPNDPITREQLAAMLMNYAQYKGMDVSARADLSHYSDAENISSWANDVLSWAVAEGLLTGVTDDTIAPQVHATRAQVAAILQRFLSE